MHYMNPRDIACLDYAIAALLYVDKKSRPSATEISSEVWIKKDEVSYRINLGEFVERIDETTLPDGAPDAVRILEDAGIVGQEKAYAYHQKRWIATAGFVSELENVSQRIENRSPLSRRLSHYAQNGLPASFDPAPIWVAMERIHNANLLPQTTLERLKRREQEKADALRRYVFSLGEPAQTLLWSKAKDLGLQSVQKAVPQWFDAGGIAASAPLAPQPAMTAASAVSNSVPERLHPFSNLTTGYNPGPLLAGPQSYPVVGQVDPTSFAPVHEGALYAPWPVHSAGYSSSVHGLGHPGSSSAGPQSYPVVGQVDPTPFAPVQEQSVYAPWPTIDGPENRPHSNHLQNSGYPVVPGNMTGLGSQQAQHRH